MICTCTSTRRTSSERGSARVAVSSNRIASSSLPSGSSVESTKSVYMVVRLGFSCSARRNDASAWAHSCSNACTWPIAACASARKRVQLDGLECRRPHDRVGLILRHANRPRRERIGQCRNCSAIPAYAGANVGSFFTTWSNSSMATPGHPRTTRLQDACFQKQIVRLDRGRVPPLSASELQPQLVDDGPRDLVLDREDVLQLAIEVPRPERHIVGNADELRVDAHPVTLSQHRSFERSGRLERRPHFVRVARLVLEGERRRRDRTSSPSITARFRMISSVRPSDEVLALRLDAQVLEAAAPQ